MCEILTAAPRRLPFDMSGVQKPAQQAFERPRRLMGWTPPVFRATLAHWSSLACGSGLRTKGVRHECYNRCRRFGKVRLPAGRGRCVLARDRNPAPDAHPVRALVCQSRCGPGHHGVVRLGPSLGALADRPGDRSEAAAGPVRARLCATQQDRCGRCDGPAGSRSRIRHSPGACQIDRTASPAGAAPHPQPVDGHAHFAHQRLARLLP